MKQSEIARLLPDIFQRTLREGNPLLLLLAIMEQFHAPAEEVLTEFERYFDPYRTPDAFVPFLASWVDLAALLRAQAETSTTVEPFPPGLGRLRELIAAAAYLSQWRGTRAGLIRFLTTATGLTGFAIDEQVVGPEGQVIPFHIQVVAPAAAEPHRSLLARIIEIEKPAHVTYDLIFTEKPPRRRVET